MVVAVAATILGCGGHSHSGGAADASVEIDGAAPSPVTDAGLPDVAIPAGSSIVVSPDGDDANDPLAAPLRTLGRAVAIATRHPEFTTIFLRAGRYSAASGESFPYAVPNGVALIGPLTGEAALVGDGAVDGLYLRDGALQGVALEAFATAVTARGASAWADVDIRDSKLGAQLDQESTVTALRVRISAAAATCRLGMDVGGNARLDAYRLAITAGRGGIFAHDHGAVSIRASSFDSNKDCLRGSLETTSSAPFVVTDSEISGGWAGLGLSGTGAISVSRVQIHDSDDGIRSNATNVTIEDMVVTQTIGVGIAVFGGHWVIHNFRSDGTTDIALDVSNPADVPTSLTVRDSTLRGKSFGLAVSHDAQMDLGTVADPGHNIIQGATKSVYLSYPPEVAPVVINAVGNTWQPYRQGADPDGHYTARVIASPLATNDYGDNFWLFGLGWQIQL